MKLLTLVLCAASLPLLAEDPSFTPQERANVIQLLKDSRKETIDAVKDLTDEQWKWKPAPDRWSVGEVAEHIGVEPAHERDCLDVLAPAVLVRNPLALFS